MATVATGLQDGCKVVELFGGARKKKVFIYLPSGKKISIELIAEEKLHSPFLTSVIFFGV